MKAAWKGLKPEMRPVTILHTIETSGPGGAETVLLKLATRLDPARFRSLVILNQEGWLLDQLLAHKVPTTLVAWHTWYDFRLPRTLARLVRDERVDLIHSHLPDQNFYSSLVGAWTGCKTLVTYHGPVEFRRARKWRGAVKLWIVRRTSSVTIVVCDYVARIMEEFSFPRQKIVRIYNGVDLERFTNPSRIQLRQEVGFATGTPLVGMVANVRQTKGHQYLIRAAQRVLDRCPEARFLAIGDVDERLGVGLRQLLRELHLEDKFLFLGFRQDIPEILAELDVFVLSSTSEGFPLVVLEAMAAGKPVVVTRSGGPDEIIRDGQDGFLVPVADADALAGKILEILQNPTLAATVGRQAQERVAEEFSDERMIQEYEALYQRLVGTAGRL
jgi:glycosyltransferase involved in cell wall biosynthesis